MCSVMKGMVGVKHPLLGAKELVALGDHICVGKMIYLKQSSKHCVLCVLNSNSFKG